MLLMVCPAIKAAGVEAAAAAVAAGLAAAREVLLLLLLLAAATVRVTRAFCTGAAMCEGWGWPVVLFDAVGFAMGAAAGGLGCCWCCCCGVLQSQPPICSSSKATGAGGRGRGIGSRNVHKSDTQSHDGL